MYNQKFDPLSAKHSAGEDVVIRSLKREISNILSSYVGWFDPFCELIQNALDAIDERILIEEEEYFPQLSISINLKENYITVTDNGIAFDEEKYRKFLAPNFSFKGKNFRGHKGVGATYLAYGFNYMQIATKSSDFTAVGVIKNAKNWLSDENPASNPQVEPDKNNVVDENFAKIDRGTSFCIKFDKNTVPGDLTWIQIKSAQSWLHMLRIKTGLGAIKPSKYDININLRVIDKNDKVTDANLMQPEYLWGNEIANKMANFTEIMVANESLFKKHGNNFRIPSKFSDLQGVYDYWDSDRIATEIKISDEFLDIFDAHKPVVYFCYVYSLSVWKSFNEKSEIRSGQNMLYGGIQLFADNMPQGELIQIPLTKNTGRQFQAHICIHFENCMADLGRKGFQKDITDLAKDISKKLVDGPLSKIKENLKRNSGASPDLMREHKLDEWKKEFVEHEQNSPLSLLNNNFFMPTNQISITSTPTREQDVIALFNQLVAGGVIRGIDIMSTNERFTYDGLYRVKILPPLEIQKYDNISNPLGIAEDSLVEILENYPNGFRSEPKVLEYKFSLNGLVQDINSGVKNSNDIGLVVAWEAGDEYTELFFIKSLLLDSSAESRQYHGATHILFDYSTQERVCDLILLKDLIQYLNNTSDWEEFQNQYDEQ